MSFDPRLGALFVFSADDLAANRAGRLSDDQTAQVAAGIRGTRRHLSRGRVLITVAVLAAFVAAVVVSRSPGGGGGGALPIVLAAGVLAVMFGAVRLVQRRWTRSLDTSERADLRTTEGPFEWASSLDGDWIGTIGDARFSIDRAYLPALDHGGRFRVHYLPWHNNFAWVLSIERIDQPAT